MNTDISPLKKTIISSLLSLFSFTYLIGQQDTIVVQTLTFDSINSRSGIWQFPPESESFRKILMYYTLKCDAATTTDSYPCGEWDYITNTVLNEPTEVYDSVRREHPRWHYLNQPQDTIKYVTHPYNDYFERYEYYVNNTDSVESIYSIGLGNDNSDVVFGASSPEMRVQVVWTASELIASGLVAGGINKIQFNLSQLGGGLRELKIKMKNSSNDSLSGFETNGFQEVYSRNTEFTSVGIQTLDFNNPFIWDGTSSIIMEFSFNNYVSVNGYNSSDNITTSSNTNTSSVAYVKGKDGYLLIEEGEYVDIKTGAIEFDDQVTITFWAKGDEDVLPRNSSIVEGKDVNQNRRLNIHFPWSNNQVYWDAGMRNNTDSRINKQAIGSEITGNWAHWAFTKNASTGEMKIFKNGVLWHSGNGKIDLIDEITSFRLGSSLNGANDWVGKMDEFRVWNVELDESTISDWMNKKVDSSHPNYSNLVLYYDFDDHYKIEDKSGNGRDGAISSIGMLQNYTEEEYFKAATLSTNRPDVSFVQGTYTNSIDSLIVLDSVIVEPISVTEYMVVNRHFEVSNISYFWPEGSSKTYDYEGSLIQEDFISPIMELVNDTIHYYKEPFEVLNKYELGRYITPYGIGLSLGSGFTWVYDVTDFAHLLHDSVNINSPNFSELVDIKFLMIKGTPAREVLNSFQVWDLPVNSSTGVGGAFGVYKYRDLDDDLVLSNKTIHLDNQTEYLKLKATITGHGHHSSNGSYPHCCEWKDNSHYIFANGQQVADWRIWQANDCALNPVYPQGGTWIGAREGWCPGDIVKGMEVELSDYIIGDSINLDYDITPVPSNNQGMGNGDYVMSMELIQYAEANFELDAEVYDVINPNNRGYYSRVNPICNGIKLVIRNSGTTPLESLKLLYEVSGGVQFQYDWTGNLKFMESEIVEIPFWGGQFWIGDGTNRFKVTAVQPNGGADENLENNTYTTQFELPEVYDQIALRYKTNNNPQDNTISITDSWGDVVYFKDNLTANTTYQDTLELPEGCYVLNLLDKANDGLSYWAYSAQGSGYFQIRKASGGMYKQFNSEFGRQIKHAFSIGNIVNIDEGKELSLGVYPNPSNGIFNIEVKKNIEEVTVRVLNSAGQLIEIKQLDLSHSNVSQIDLSHLTKGVYVLLFDNGNSFNTKKITID